MDFHEYLNEKRAAEEKQQKATTIKYSVVVAVLICIWYAVCAGVI